MVAILPARHALQTQPAAVRVTEFFKTAPRRIGRLSAYMADDPHIAALTAIPNVGPAVARRLLRLGIATPQDLRGQDPDGLFERICALDGRREDPCLLDTFAAAVDVADGKPARPWWEYSRERKAAAGG